MRIRPATFGDLEALCGLMEDLMGQEVPRETIRRRLEMLRLDAAERLYVCETAGAVEGAFGFRLRENLEDDTCHGEVSLLVTARHARGKGLGQVMMRYAEGLAREHGCIGTWLVSGFGREEAAHGFYQNLGYRITGYRFVKALEPSPTPP